MQNMLINCLIYIYIIDNLVFCNKFGCFLFLLI